MCAVFGFLDYKGRVSNAVLKKLIHYLSIAAEVRGTNATGIAYVRGGIIITYKKPKPAHKVKLFFPKVHTISHRTHPVHHAGQRKAELQQPPVRRTLRQRIVCSCPQRRAVQRQGASPGTASPNDTDRNRQLRRRAASGTGAAAGHGKHPENRRTGGRQLCLYDFEKRQYIVSGEGQ